MIGPPPFIEATKRAMEMQYNFAVSNYCEYPDELFRPAPDLPVRSKNSCSAAIVFEQAAKSFSTENVRPHVGSWLV
jgi:hypothetical protein